MSFSIFIGLNVILLSGTGMPMRFGGLNGVLRAGAVRFAQVVFSTNSSTSVLVVL